MDGRAVKCWVESCQERATHTIVWPLFEQAAWTLLCEQHAVYYAGGGWGCLARSIDELKREQEEAVVSSVEAFEDVKGGAYFRCTECGSEYQTFRAARDCQHVTAADIAEAEWFEAHKQELEEELRKGVEAQEAYFAANPGAREELPL